MTALRPSRRTEGTRVRRRLVDATARPRLVAGALAVTLLLFGTRWAGYLGVQPIYLTDVLVSCAFVGFVLRALNRPADLAVRRPAGGTPLFLAAAFGFVLVRFLLGADHSIVAIRDALPYFYIALGLLAMFALRRASEATRANTYRLFVVALSLHAVWFTAQEVFPAFPYSLPTLNAVQNVHFFAPRPDVDTAFVGVLAALVLWRLLHGGRRRVLLSLVYIACIASVAASFTRAGLLGTIVASAYVLLATLSERDRDIRAKGVLVAAIPLILVTAIIAVSFTAVGTKLVATVDPDAVSGNQVASGAEGTTRARANAWNRLIEWTTSDSGRASVGVGFGPDFLADSGAASLLVGDALDQDVRPRSPHNYWLGTFARLGGIGLGLVVLAVLAFLVRAWRQRRAVGGDPFTLLVILVPLSLLLPASLGVVLESPFGAVPFWWCLGAAVGWPIARGIPAGPARTPIRR